MLFTVDGESNASKSGTSKRLSVHGCEAHFFMSAMELLTALPTGTHIKRACSFKTVAAFPVLIGLIGLPSVMTTTTVFVSSRPSMIFEFISAKANDVRVVRRGQDMSLIAARTAPMSPVKRLT